MSEIGWGALLVTACLLPAIAHGDRTQDSPPLLFLATHTNYAWAPTKVGVAATADGSLWSVDVPEEYCEWLACSWFTVKAYLPRSRVDATFHRTRKLRGHIDSDRLERLKVLLAQASEGPIGAPRNCGADAGMSRLIAYAPADQYHVSYASSLIYLGGDVCLDNESNAVKELMQLLDKILADHDTSIPWFCPAHCDFEQS